MPAGVTWSHGFGEDGLTFREASFPLGSEKPCFPWVGSRKAQQELCIFLFCMAESHTIQNQEAETQTIHLNARTTNEFQDQVVNLSQYTVTIDKTCAHSAVDRAI